jgi:hypothetical protein
MSIVEYTTIGGGLLGLDQRVNQRYFWIRKGTVSKKRHIYRRQELKDLKSSSAMQEAANAWNLLTIEQKNAWQEAADEIELTPYSAYLQDKMYRIKNSIVGNGTPNAFYQYLVGHLEMPASIGHFLLRQVGPDNFEFPASLHLHYKTNLNDENSPNGYLKLIFRYKYNDGGGEQVQENEINLNLTTDWTSQNVGITEHSGQIGHWEMDIEGNYINGDFWFDNIYLLGADGILTKDPHCEIQGLKYNRILFPEGMNAESIYLT